MSEWIDHSEDSDDGAGNWSVELGGWELWVYEHGEGWEWTAGPRWDESMAPVFDGALSALAPDAAKAEAVAALRAAFQRMIDALPIIDAQNQIETAMLAWVRETYARSPADVRPISAIKAARERTGCSLKDAKDTHRTLMERGVLRYDSDGTCLVPEEIA